MQFMARMICLCLVYWSRIAKICWNTLRKCLWFLFEDLGIVWSMFLHRLHVQCPVSGSGITQLLILLHVTLNWIFINECKCFIFLKKHIIIDICPFLVIPCWGSLIIIDAALLSCILFLDEKAGDSPQCGKPKYRGLKKFTSS